MKAWFSLCQCKNLEDLHSLQRMVFLPHEVDALFVEIPFGWRNSINVDWPDPVNFLSYLELTEYLQNTLLQDIDKMSMAHSLEVRVPFLDHLLVEYVAKIPGYLKIGDDYPKRLLVKAAKDLLPQEIYNRPKMGFVFPFEMWFRQKGIDYLKEQMSEKTIKRIPMLNTEMILEIRNAFLGGSNQYNYPCILTLLSFIIWYNKNIA